MSFDDRETSAFDGEPQELYWFMRGSENWFYTSGAYPVTLGDNTYQPLAGLQRENVTLGKDRARNQLTVNMPRTTDVIHGFIGVPEQAAIWLYIYKIHKGDSDYVIFWQGRISAVEFKGEKAIVTLDDLMSSTKKQSFRAFYQNQCNNFTFDTNCKLVEDDFTYNDVEILSIDGDQLTFDNVEAASWFVSGQIRMPNGDRRMIIADTKASSTHTVTLLQPFENLEVGDLVKAIGGACRHTFATCQIVNTKGGGTEDNSENYGGYPLVPTKDPFRSFI